MEEKLVVTTNVRFLRGEIAPKVCLEISSENFPPVKYPLEIDAYPRADKRNFKLCVRNFPV